MEDNSWTLTDGWKTVQMCIRLSDSPVCLVISAQPVGFIVHWLRVLGVRVTVRSGVTC